MELIGYGTVRIPIGNALWKSSRKSTKIRLPSFRHIFALADLFALKGAPKMTDTQKFKSLVHYICAQSPDPAKLGATKLNKILWFAEKEAFLRLGSPISSERYVKRQFGPVPADIVPVLNELEEEGKILIWNVEYFGKAKREFISRVEPSLERFSASEVSIINRAINVICNRHTAVSISDKSHDEIWELAEIGEEIPFHAAFGSRGEVTEEHMSWARSQANELLEESA